MSQVVITAPRNQVQAPSVAPRNMDIKTPKMQKIEREIESDSAKRYGEQAFQKAISELSKMLEGRDVQVTSIFDASKGTQVRVTDSITGKKLIELPPQAVVEMAEKARNQQIGWMIDQKI